MKVGKFQVSSSKRRSGNLELADLKLADLELADLELETIAHKSDTPAAQAMR